MDFAGIPIQVSQHMTGSKRALRFGNGPIILSPAMYELVRHAEGDELARLLAAIPLLQLPDLGIGKFGPLSLTTRPQGGYQ